MFDMSFLLPNYDEPEPIRMFVCPDDEIPASEKARLDAELDAMIDQGAFDRDNEALP
jgi:hypothetical protein